MESAVTQVRLMHQLVFRPHKPGSRTLAHSPRSGRRVDPALSGSVEESLATSPGRITKYMAVTHALPKKGV
jgi:hypothetical protein